MADWAAEVDVGVVEELKDEAGSIGVGVVEAEEGVIRLDSEVAGPALTVTVVEGVWANAEVTLLSREAPWDSNEVRLTCALAPPSSRDTTAYCRTLMVPTIFKSNGVLDTGKGLRMFAKHVISLTLLLKSMERTKSLRME